MSLRPGAPARRGGRAQPQKGAQGSRGTVWPKAPRPLTPSLSAASPTSQAVSGQGQLTGVTCRASQQRACCFLSHSGTLGIHASHTLRSVLPARWQRQFIFISPNNICPRQSSIPERSLSGSLNARTEHVGCLASQSFRQGFLLTPANQCPQLLPRRSRHPCSQTWRGAQSQVKDLF